MVSYIVLLDLSAAFHRVSYSGPLFKFKSIGVGGSAMSICGEFLSNRRQRAVVEDDISEWIPIVSGMPQACVLGPFLLILYSNEMFELVENRGASSTSF